MLGVKTAALPASLRRTNQRTIISLLMRLGCASRAELAKAAGMSQPTAGKITTDLLRLGILQEVDGTNGRVPRLGRPGQMLRLADRDPRFVVLELGVNETRMAMLPVAVQLEDRWTQRIPTLASGAALAKELKRAASASVQGQFWGVLISVPGIVDENAGRVLFSPNLHWLESADLDKLARQVWDAPVLLVQEIRALALGQLTADPGGEDFLLVDFGQGVGGAIVLEGKLYPHPMPLSGELGHTPVAGNQRRCGCGATGCLETLVSERGLLESFGCGDWEALVGHVSANGIPAWLSETLAATAKVIAGALNVLGIHRVIVTGLLTELPGCVDALSAEIKAGSMWARFGQVECQGAPRRRSAGLVAAGLDRLVLPAAEDRRLLTSEGAKERRKF
jgi:predicted NBD/HSP70 family sugar kinase